MRTICLLAMLGILIYVSTIFAGVPEKISFQGYVTDLSQNPISGEHLMGFKIYDSQSGGNLLWSDSYTLQLVNGQFHAYLGENTALPAGIFTGQVLWLETWIDGSVLPARQPLVSVAYSFHAQKADSAQIAFHSQKADSAVLALSTASGGDTLWQTDGTNIFRGGSGTVGIGTPSTTDARLSVVAPDGDGKALKVRSAFGSGTVPDDAPVFSVEDDSHFELFRVQENGQTRVRGDLGVGSDPSASPDSRLVAVGANGVGRALRVRSAFGSGTVPEDAAVFLVKDDSDFELFRVQENGRTRVKILEITGGSDLAEPFPVHDAQTMGPGMVVSIDPQNPGNLKLATEPYDLKVAGVISGANDLGPGMVMSNTDQNESGPRVKVALTGRVWCWADASNGPITPGDLLTTSDTPGHAMRVTEYVRAQGTVLGKAMSSLESGRGLVLVLVNLQ